MVSIMCPGGCFEPWPLGSSFKSGPPKAGQHAEVRKVIVVCVQEDPQKGGKPTKTVVCHCFPTRQLGRLIRVDVIVRNVESCYAEIEMTLESNCHPRSIVYHGVDCFSCPLLQQLEEAMILML